MLFSSNYKLTALRRSVTVGAMSLLFAACAGTQVDANSEATPGESFSGNYLAGRHAQIEGNANAATTYLGAALKHDPLQPDLLRRTFLVHLSDGRMSEAIELARKVVEVVPQDSFATFTLAAHSLKTGDYARAREQLGTLSADGLNVYLAPLLMAWAQFGDSDSATALSIIAPLKAAQATSMLHDAHAALIHLAAGESEQAEAMFSDLAEKQGGMSLHTVELFGAMYEQTGQFDKAGALYNGYINEHGTAQLMRSALERVAQREASSDFSISAADGAAEAMFDIAGSLRQQNAIESALLLARLGLYLRADFPVLQLMTGSVLEDINNFTAANEIYASVDPNSDYALATKMRMASNLDDMGETDQAIKTLQALADKNPETASPLIDLGDILRSADRFTDAVAAYDGAFARITDPGERYWSLYYARGIALERSGDWTRSEADFLKALEFKPEQPYVLNYLGYSWVDKGMHLDRAQEMIRKAVELRPNDGYIVDSLGWVYYRLGDYENAVSELERAVELMPQDPIINEHLGDAYWQIGRHREARFQWRRSLGFKPEADAIPIIESKIENGMSEPQPAIGDGGNGNG